VGSKDAALFCLHYEPRRCHPAGAVSRLIRGFYSLAMLTK
jgi:hypothetical protein